MNEDILCNRFELLLASSSYFVMLILFVILQGYVDMEHYMPESFWKQALLVAFVLSLFFLFIMCK